MSRPVTEGNFLTALIFPTSLVQFLQISCFFLLSFFFHVYFIYLSICQSQVLVAACVVFSCGMWTLSCHTWDLVPWSRIKPRPPVLGAWNFSHWATREVPVYLTLGSYFSPGILTVNSSMVCACMLNHFNHVWLFATAWTIAHQVPLSIEFSRQEHWSRLSCPPLGDCPNPGAEPASLMSPALVGRFLEPPRKPPSMVVGSLSYGKPCPSRMIMTHLLDSEVQGPTLSPQLYWTYWFITWLPPFRNAFNYCL